MAKKKIKAPAKKKPAAKKRVVKKVAKKKAPAAEKKKPVARRQRALPFERMYKLIITRKLPSTGVVDYWCWGNTWSTDKRAAHKFDRDYEASVAMVTYVISHGKVIESR